MARQSAAETPARTRTRLKKIVAILEATHAPGDEDFFFDS